jgi:predicted kinase
MKLIILVGLPASGKTTWAKAYVSAHNNVIRVNKDDLRAMLHNGEYSKENENIVKKVRDMIMSVGFSNGQTVISDDCNMNPEHIDQMTKFANWNGVPVVIRKEFLDVPIGICISRDLRRASEGKKVGAAEIKKMDKEYTHFHK